MQRLILASEFTETAQAACALFASEITGKKAVFIPTAAYGEGYEPDEDLEIAAFRDLQIETQSFDIAGKNHDQVRDVLQGAAIVYVGGGNTFYLLEHMNKCGFSALIQEHFNRGGIYVGSSAGSIVASPDIGFIAPMDDPDKGQLDSYEALGLIDFNFVPHLDHPDMGKAAAEIMENDKSGARSTWGLRDNQFLYVRGASVEVYSL